MRTQKEKRNRNARCFPWNDSNYGIQLSIKRMIMFHKRFNTYKIDRLFPKKKKTLFDIIKIDKNQLSRHFTTESYDFSRKCRRTFTVSAEKSNKN